MAPVAVTVRCRFSGGGEARDASFRGLFHDRSARAVQDRLREVHRFAEHVEVVEVRWHDPGEPPVAPRQGSGS